PKKYTFISSDLKTIANIEAQNLKFSIKQGDKVYIIDELYFVKDGFVYEVSINLPENEYEKSKTQFIDTLNKIRFYTIDESKYQKDLEKYKNKNLAVRVSQQDVTFDYLNKTYNWSAKIPGYWTKFSSDDTTTTFENPNTNVSVMINALENNSRTKTLPDEEKFGIMQMLKSTYKVTPIQSVTNEKGYQMRTYTYKVENIDSDLFLAVTCYCFESEKYSYCYVSIVPDLTATDEAVKEVNDIWKSFKIGE
ncbi:MAG: copper amine oxidase N-terminal domain-containing protein, partial [Ruminiclostridium sp.]